MMGGLEFYLIAFVLIVTGLGIIYIVAKANSIPIPAWFFQIAGLVALAIFAVWAIKTVFRSGAF